MKPLGTLFCEEYHLNFAHSPTAFYKDLFLKMDMVNYAVSARDPAIRARPPLTTLLLNVRLIIIGIGHDNTVISRVFMCMCMASAHACASVPCMCVCAVSAARGVSKMCPNAW